MINLASGQAVGVVAGTAVAENLIGGLPQPGLLLGPQDLYDPAGTSSSIAAMSTKLSDYAQPFSRHVLTLPTLPALR